MPAASRRIEPEDLWPLERYREERKRLRRELVAKKRQRRLSVGPVATFHFENFDTMWAQVQEMLYIEKGGSAQIEDELRAYNPLIPQGRELVATVMFEIDDPQRRRAFLARLGGVENTAFLEIEGSRVAGQPEADVERTTPGGKASAVQFLHFPMSEAQAAAFKRPGARVVVGFGHPEYSHMAVMPEEVRLALAADLA